MLTPHDLIDFESRIAAHFAAGNLPCLIHLSGGNEEQLIEIFRDIRPEDWVFSTHRNHYHALLKGIPPAQLEAEILAGYSMFIYSREHRFITSAILAGTCAIAAGVAWDLKQQSILQEATEATEKESSVTSVPSCKKAWVYCFLGDGAEEEGHFYEAALFAEANALPITFIIEDNQRQVDTDKGTRRGINLRDSHAWRPLDHFKCVRRYHYKPTYPHGGAGLKSFVTHNPEAIERHRAQANK